MPKLNKYYLVRKGGPQIRLDKSILIICNYFRKNHLLKSSIVIAIDRGFIACFKRFLTMRLVTSFLIELCGSEVYSVEKVKL